MTKKIDLTGGKYNNLTVTSFSHRREVNGYYEYYWNCKCDCGNKTIVRSNGLTSGGTKSCGCLVGKLAYERINKINEKYHVEGTDLSLITSKIIKSNKSGITGVHWYNSRQKWRATLQIRGNQIFIGYFDKLEDAKKARKEAEEKYFIPILEKYNRGE